MINSEIALRAVLLADGTLSGLIGTQLYPGAAPQSIALPFGLMARTMGDHQHHMTAGSGLIHTSITIDWFAATQAGALAIAEAARLVGDGYTGAVTVGAESVTLGQCYMMSDRTTYINRSDGADIGVYGISQDWELWHDETV